MRLEGQAKSGYYPTPDHLMPAIASLICPVSGSGNIRILDPCAGEGLAAAALREHLSAANPHHEVQAYGVELNAQRATKARQVLEQCLRADISETDLPPESADILFLNPPYDWAQDEEINTRRLESAFLHRATPALHADGALIYIATGRQLAEDASYLARNYYGFEVWRFPERDFAEFGQFALIALRQHQLNGMLGLYRDINWLRSLGNVRQARNTKPLSISRDPAAAPRIAFDVTLKGRPYNLRRRDVDSDVLEQAIASSGAWTTPAVKRATSPSDNILPIATLAPVNAGQALLLIASGQLDNQVLYCPGKEPIAIQGMITKKRDTAHPTDYKTVTTDYFASTIRYVGLVNGEVAEVSDTDTDQLREFLDDYRDAIKNAIVRCFEPTYQPDAPPPRPPGRKGRRRWRSRRRRSLSDNNPIIDRIRERLPHRKPVGKQIADAAMLTHRLANHHSALMLGKQGTGKTFISLMTAAGMDAARCIVASPPHVIPGWIEEIQSVWPSARTRVCRTISAGKSCPARDQHGPSALNDAMALPASPESPVFIIIPQTAGSLGYRVTGIERKVSPTASRRLCRIAASGLPDSPTRIIAANQTLETCPYCYFMLTGDPRYDRKSHSRDLRCPNCRTHLKEFDRQSVRSYPLFDYIARKRHGWADLLIIDEVHEYKAKTTARGEALGRLAQRSRKVLGLTGTYIGGLVSNIFHLSHRLRPDFSATHPWDNLDGFIEAYGRYQVSEYQMPNDDSNDRVGSMSNARAAKRYKTEVPGFHPALLRYVLDFAVFTTIPDLKADLPDDHPLKCLPPPMIYAETLPLASSPFGNDTISQQDWYDRLESAFREYCGAGRGRLARLQGLLKEELLSGPENCWQGTAPCDAQDGITIVAMPPLASNALYPKEQRLLEIVRDQKERGRKFLIYCTHTDRRSVVERLMTILKEADIDVAYMSAKKVSANNRLKWLREQAIAVDGIILNPKSVATGLNLQDFPTIIWQEVDYSMYVTDQASARSYRINQTQEVEIYHLAYAGTLQEQAIKRVAAKSDATRSLYGDLGPNGLSIMNPSAERFQDIIESDLFQMLAAERGSPTRAARPVKVEVDHQNARPIARPALDVAVSTVLDGPAWPNPSIDVEAVKYPLPLAEPISVMPQPAALNVPNNDPAPVSDDAPAVQKLLFPDLPPPPRRRRKPSPVNIAQLTLAGF